MRQPRPIPIRRLIRVGMMYAALATNGFASIKLEADTQPIPTSGSAVDSFSSSAPR